MTSVGTITPLTILLDIVFKKMRREKTFMLSNTKENALKDCIATAPRMMALSFSKEGLVKSFVSAGMIDAKTNTCPDLYAIVDSFKIYWNSVSGDKIS